MKHVSVALCESRHPMPAEVTGSIFSNTEELDVDVLFRKAVAFIRDTFPDRKNTTYSCDPEDTHFATSVCAEYGDLQWWHRPGRLTVYVTGFTPALIAVINACRVEGVSYLTLKHYDRETGNYLSQEVEW